MDSANNQDTAGVNGVINLTDYFPVKNSYNPVVYMHKKFLSKERTSKKFKIEEKPFEQHNEDIKRIKTQDKCEQFDCDKIKRDTYKTKIINNSQDKDPLIEQTIRFATDIIPLTIPPSTNDIPNPVYYTIKPCKRIKRKHEPRQRNADQYKDVTFNKEKSKSAIKNVDKERFKCNEESFSCRESVSRSSESNTLNDINENKSLCFSISESTERKHFIKDDNRKKNKKNDLQKITASESFEAIATEYMNTSDAKIKVHLMNDKEKQLLYENIRAPVVKVIKQCFSELQNHDEVNLDLQYVHTALQSQETKLNRIMSKLDQIDKKLDLFGSSVYDISKKNNGKSKLEELGQDILEEKKESSSEEELAEISFTKRKAKTPAVVTMVSEKDHGPTVDDLAKGENIPKNYEASAAYILGVKPDRPNRIPARYCWTDTVKKM